MHTKCLIVLVHFFGLPHVKSSMPFLYLRTSSIHGVLPLSQTTLTWANTMILINTLIKTLHLTSYLLFLHLLLLPTSLSSLQIHTLLGIDGEKQCSCFQVRLFPFLFFNQLLNPLFTHHSLNDFLVKFFTPIKLVA